MELRKGYKQTEIGIFPRDWDTQSLIHLAERKKELFDDGDWIESEHITDEGIRLVQTGNLGEGKFIEKDVKKYIYQESFELLKCKELYEGDLLICRLAEPAGRACIFPKLDELKVITSVDVTIFRPSHDVVNRQYLNQVFTTQKWFNTVSENCGGTTHKRISRGALGKLLVPLPNLIEQTAIATALSDMDNLIAGLEKLIEKKKAIKQGAMQDLLRPKKGWMVKSLGECLLKSPDYGINAASITYSDALPTYIRITDISNDGRFLGDNKTSVNHPMSDKYCLEENDIVFARTGASVGKTYLYNKEDGKLVYAGFLIRVKPDPRLLNSIYLQNFTTTKKYWNWVSLMSMRSGQPGINGNEFAQLEIPIPATIEEQNEIAHILSEMDSEIHNLKLSLSKYSNLKLGMMQELLTGNTRLV